MTFGALRILGWCFVTVGLILGTSLIFAWLASLFSGTDVTDAVSWGSGIVCGLAALLLLVVFHVKTDSLEFNMDEHREPLHEMSEALVALGYDVQQRGEEALTARPSFSSLLFGGDVQIRTEANKVTATGPKLSLEQLRRQIRLRAFVTDRPRKAKELTATTENGQLGRVHLSFTIPSNKDTAILSDIVQAFNKMGAEVACEVSLLAKSEKGIAEEDLWVLIEHNMTSQGIAVSMHKKHLEARPATTAGTAEPTPVA